MRSFDPPVDPKSVKRYWQCDSVFTILGSAVNFKNVQRAAFAPIDPKSVKRYQWPDWILTLLGAMGIKAARNYVGEIEPCKDNWTY